MPALYTLACRVAPFDLSRINHILTAAKQFSQLLQSKYKNINKVDVLGNKRRKKKNVYTTCVGAWTNSGFV